MIRATMLGLGTAALLLAAATLLAADSAAGAEKTPEEELRDVAAETFAGVKDALAAGDEALGLRVVEGALRVAWARAKLATLKQGKAAEESHIVELDELWQKREAVHEQTLARTKAAYEQHIAETKAIYNQERARMKTLVDEMVKRVEALEAENKILRVRLEGKTESPAGQKPAAESEAAKPPAKLNELLAAARAYLAVVPGETQAARQARQAETLEPFIGREFILAGILENVETKKGSDLLTVKLKYESARKITYTAGEPLGFSSRTWSVTEPAEIVTVDVTTADRSATELRTGTRVTIRGRLVKATVQGVAAGKGVRMTIEAEAGELSQ